MENALLLGGVVMAVVDRRDAGDAAAGVVQDGLDYLHREAQPRHAGCGRAAQIVEAPRRDLDGLATLLCRDLLDLGAAAA